MLAKPLYEKHKPVAKPRMVGKPARQRSSMPHLLLGACLLLLVLIFGAAVAVSSFGARDASEDEAKQASAPVPAPGNGSAQNGGAPQAASNRTGAAAAQKAKLPSTAAPESSELKLDVFKFPVVSEADAAERMQQILSFFEHGNSSEKRAAYRALVDMGAYAAAPLPGAIERADERALTWLAMAAAQLKVAAADRKLIERVEKAGGKVDNNVVLAIGKLATPAAHDFCIASMKQDTNTKFREVAWEALTNCANAEDIPLLFSALEKGERYQQERAAQALGHLGQNPAILPQIVLSMEKALGQGENSPNRMAYARAVASLPSKEVQPLLTGLMYDRNADVRVLAIKGLGSETATMGVMLTSLQNETDPRVLKTAANCLAEQPYEMATPKLLGWLNANNGDLSGAAYKALLAAYGQDCGYSSGPWEAWLKLGAQEGDPNRSKVFAARLRKLRDDMHAQQGMLAYGG